MLKYYFSGLKTTLEPLNAREILLLFKNKVSLDLRHLLDRLPFGLPHFLFRFISLHLTTFNARFLKSEKKITVLGHFTERQLIDSISPGQEHFTERTFYGRQFIMWTFHKRTFLRLDI